LRKLAIILVAGLVVAGGFWLALRQARLSQDEITEMPKARAEVEDSVKCGHDCVPGSSAYVQCKLQSNAARTAQLELRGALDVKGRDGVTGMVARVRAAIVMLVAFLIMMLVVLGFWSLGTWIGLDERRRR